MKKKLFLSFAQIATFMLLALIFAGPGYAAINQSSEPKSGVKPMTGSPSSFNQQCQEIMKNPDHKTDSTRLHQLFEVSWNSDLDDSPEGSTYLGEKGRDHLWNDISEQKFKEFEGKTKTKLKVLQSIKYAQLNPADQLNYDIFKSQLENEISSYKFKGEYLQIDQMGGIQQSVSQMLMVMPTESLEDFENRIQRLARVPQLLDQTIALLKKGIQAKITPPKITLRDVPDQIKKHTETNLENNPLFQSFKKIPDSISKAEQEKILAKARKTILEITIPAFEKFHTFVKEQYIPGCRDSISWSALPQGKEWYAFLVSKSTTTVLTAKEIHELGLFEVNRIQKEIDGTLKAIRFNGNRKEFVEKLYKNPDNFYSKKTDLIQGYEKLAKKIEPQLPLLFMKLPKLPYEISSVPEYSEKSQPAGYYQDGALASKRPGIFYVNAYNLKDRPKWEMTALFLHEAVPGHHLQISFAHELDSVPNFRKHSHYTAYIEGWGLYAEKLGYDINVYNDVNSRFGQLNFELWRAIRLVVDTGIHSLGWSREKAIEYFRANSVKDTHEITVEVDRYIVMPAQALAYKIGQLKFLELRELTKKQLEGAFDIRKYHQTVLQSGALPLDILEKQVQNWIEITKTDEPSELGQVAQKDGPL